MQDRHHNLVDLIAWESRGVPGRSNAGQMGSVVICVVPDGPLVHDREWNTNIMFRSLDPAGGMTLFAKGLVLKELALKGSSRR
jgi:hypothetical protein